jgi:hypothetical protein
MDLRGGFPRRRFLGAGAAAALGLGAAPVLAAVPALGRLLFYVRRQGQRIGEHRISFSTSGDLVTATTEVDMAVKLGPVTLFRYAHHARERWRGGRFESLESHTDVNGRTLHVTASRSGDAVLIESSSVGKITASPDAVPLTNWNLQAMRTPLFNPQSGRLLRVTAAHSRATFAGAPATQVAIRGEAQLTDWYDASGVWLALNGKVKDGSVVEYRRA